MPPLSIKPNPLQGKNPGKGTGQYVPIDQTSQDQFRSSYTVQASQTPGSNRSDVRFSKKQEIGVGKTVAIIALVGAAVWFVSMKADERYF